MIKKTALLFLLPVIILFVSCGVILDTGKIIGTWTLDKSEFYVYNSTTDSYITYKGEDATSDDDGNPLIGSFFATNSKDISVVFDENGEFSVLDNTNSEEIVSPEYGSWDLDSYSNTLTLKIKRDKRSGYEEKYEFWSTGFKFSNSWPLTAVDSMELLIKASDLDKSTITVYNTSYKAKSMKAYFTKEDD